MSVASLYTLANSSLVDDDLSALLTQRSNLETARDNAVKALKESSGGLKGLRSDDIRGLIRDIAAKDKEIIERTAIVMQRVAKEQAEAEQKRKKCSCKIDWKNRIFQHFVRSKVELAIIGLFLAGCISEVVYNYFLDNHSSKVPFGLITTAGIVEWIQRKVSEKISEEERLRVERERGEDKLRIQLNQERIYHDLLLLMSEQAEHPEAQRAMACMSLFRAINSSQQSLLPDHDAFRRHLVRAIPQGLEAETAMDRLRDIRRRRSLIHHARASHSASSSNPVSPPSDQAAKSRGAARPTSSQYGAEDFNENDLEQLETTEREKVRKFWGKEYASRILDESAPNEAAGKVALSIQTGPSGAGGDVAVPIMDSPDAGGGSGAQPHRDGATLSVIREASTEMTPTAAAAAAAGAAGSGSVAVDIAALSPTSATPLSPSTSVV